MKIGLIDVDNTGYPNLALMKISAFHKQNGDFVEWYSAFSGLIEEYDIVYLSKIFSFSKDYEYPIYSKKVERGGTGYAIKTINGRETFCADDHTNLPEYIEHIYPDYSLYPDKTKNTAYGFLTRGCPRGCDFCIVGKKEGKKSIKVADLSEFWNGQKHIELFDPNILACSEYKELLQQLIDSDAVVNFSQGLDIRLMTDEKAELLSKIKMNTLHFAWDRIEDKDIVIPRFKMFRSKCTIRSKDLHVYCIVGDREKKY